MPIYVSASSIGDYLLCPRRVHYRINKPEAGRPDRYMLMGTIAHKVVELGWKSPSSALDVLDKEASSVGLTDKELAKQKFYINVFFTQFKSMLGEDDEIEKKFKLNLWDDVYLVGKIDRISNNNVFDWKTSSTVPKSLSNMAQFIVYKYAYTELYGTQPASVVLASLSSGSMVHYVPNLQLEDEMFSSLIPEMVKNIRNGNLPRFFGLFGNRCVRCSYKLDCLGGGEYVVDNSNSFT